MLTISWKYINKRRCTKSSGCSPHTEILRDGLNSGQIAKMYANIYTQMSVPPLLSIYLLISSRGREAEITLGLVRPLLVICIIRHIHRKGIQKKCQSFFSGTDRQTDLQTDRPTYRSSLPELKNTPGTRGWSRLCDRMMAVKSNKKKRENQLS